MSRRIPPILACTSALRQPVLDWGGGYGTLTRMLRDAGVDCWHSDPHCSNVHARGFEATLGSRGRWGAILAIEVLEHLVDPWSFLRPAAERADLIVASTCPVHEPARALGRWWYWAPEHGQHVSFYSRRCFRVIARELGMQYVPAAGLHVLARGLPWPMRLAMRAKPVRHASLAVRPIAGRLDADFDLAVRRARGG